MKKKKPTQRWCRSPKGENDDGLSDNIVELRTSDPDEVLFVFEQSTESNLQHASQLSQHEERHVELASFEATYVAAIHVRRTGESFLRQVLRTASFLKTRADPFQ